MFKCLTIGAEKIMGHEENQKRSRLETMDVILAISVNGIKKTHIMYRANLSHIQLEKYLKILISAHLLTRKDDYYVTTSQGLEYLKKFKEIQSLMEESTEIKPMQFNLR